MNLLLAEQAPANAQSGYVTIIMFVAIFAVFYFLLIRPQQKRQKELQRQIQAIKKGDKVVTNGGIKGVIQDVREDVLVIKSGETQMEVMKPYVAQVLK